MFSVGLTGGVATGKTTASNFFSEKGIDIIDADEISRSLQSIGASGYQEIVKKFGNEILNIDKSINRKTLREIAFKEPEQKKWLEDLMHPMIRDEVIKQFEEVESVWAIYSAPLWSNKNVFNRTLVIDAPKHLQLARIKERDSINPEIAEGIINAQISSNDRINYATDLIINDATIDAFNSKLDFYYNLYSKLASKKS
jgi:dephospho-CoA kinase